MSVGPICVYCASSSGNHPAYINSALCKSAFPSALYPTNTLCTRFSALGTALAKASRPLVYGGGSIGLMGAVAEAVLKNGGYVTGVSPYAMTISGGECLKVNERGEGAPTQPLARLFVESHPNRENVIVDDMHTRKQLMALNATGGFVCLPGGYGTLEEVSGCAVCASQSHAFGKYRYWKRRLGYNSRFMSSVCRLLSRMFDPCSSNPFQRSSSSMSSTTMLHFVPS